MVYFCHTYYWYVMHFLTAKCCIWWWMKRRPRDGSFNLASEKREGPGKCQSRTRILGYSRRYSGVPIDFGWEIFQLAARNRNWIWSHNSDYVHTRSFNVVNKESISYREWKHMKPNMYYQRTIYDEHCN